MRPFIPLLFTSGTLSALNIQIDYTYDVRNFFDTQEKRNAIESVAKFYGDLIQDNLLRIDPSEFSQASWTARPTNPATGLRLSIPDLIVPEDTIIVFVGARDLGGSVLGVAGPGSFGAIGFGSWFSRLRGRGQVGADHPQFSPQTNDVAPWGGSITFDEDSAWNFSLTQNEAGVEFVQVALHEMGHVLGIGTEESWDNKISGGTFTGAAAAGSFGSPPPADSGHFLDPSTGDLTSPLYGSFGTTHGSPRPVLMLPSSSDTGNNFDVITDLDLAAMLDIGWEISLPTRLLTNSLSPSAASFSWPSSSFLSYQVERDTNLSTFSGVSSLIRGDGSIQSWTDPSPLADKAFYRLRASSNTAPANISTANTLLSSPKVTSTQTSDVYRTIEVTSREATGCYCEHPEGH